LTVNTNRWIRNNEGKWIRSTIDPVIEYRDDFGKSNSQEHFESLGSEYSLGRDFFNNTGLKPNINLLD